jgi:fumarylacetoacetate (FAA) hydrolase family protein
VVEGEDGFAVQGANVMAEISRPPESLVAATIGPNHQYPDGFMLFLGTMFVPTEDRAGSGQGFTHRIGDVVRIFSPMLGTLENVVDLSSAAPPWTFGTRALMRSLAERGLS